MRKNKIEDFEFHMPTDGEMFCWKGVTLGYGGSPIVEADKCYEVIRAVKYNNQMYLMIINGKGELYTVPAHMGIIVLKGEQ